MGPLCGPPLRWWVLCGALPSVWVHCVGPLCGSPVWVPCVGPLCVGPLCGSPVCIPRRAASCCIYSRDASRSFTRSRLWGKNTEAAATATGQETVFTYPYHLCLCLSPLFCRVCSSQNFVSVTVTYQLVHIKENGHVSLSLRFCKIYCISPSPYLISRYVSVSVSLAK